MDGAIRRLFKYSVGDVEVRQQVMKWILKYSIGMLIDFV